VMPARFGLGKSLVWLEARQYFLQILHKPKTAFFK